MKIYNKLVRDKIPEIIENSGGKCNYHIADDEEFKLKLFEKIGEEYQEFLENPSIEELADLLQILERVAKTMGWSLEELKRIKAKKKFKRGGFEKRIILDSATEI